MEKKKLNEYGEDSGGQDMTHGIYNRSVEKKDSGNNDFIKKGEKDYYDGVPIDACPYEPGFNKYYKIDLAKYWKFGWTNAKEDDLGQINELRKVIRTLLKEEVTADKVGTIKFQGRKLNVFITGKHGFETLIYLDTIQGEQYIDLNTILPENKLLNAIWVKQGEIEEKIADHLIGIIHKTSRTTTSGYNTYILYEIVL